MEETTNLELLRLFHQCSHRMHMGEKYRGQGRLLILLRKHGKLTQRELTDITGRRSATLSEQLDSMDRAGLITREKNGADKRNVDVVLTQLGQTTAEDAQKAREELADKLFSVLTGEEKQQLSALLQRLSQIWDSLPFSKEE